MEQRAKTFTPVTALVIPLGDIITDTIEYIPVFLSEPREIDAGEVLAQVFEGLKFLHANGPVHGGLCPDSIRIKRSDPWSIKLSDIGLHPYVDLEGSKERELYASRSNQYVHKPVPVLDTWSAGVVGLILLSGLPHRPANPRYTQSDWTGALVIRAAAFHANDTSGPGGKKDAALFLTRVLKYAYGERLTAEECLQDPWIQHRRLPILDDRGYSAEPNDQLDFSQDGSFPRGPSSKARSVHEEANDGEGSGEDTETEEPRTSTSTSKGQQPQR